ncbi:hypothetical protein LMG28727_06336 [Paraburkholderia kirstenboschensis]|uniref:DUF4148 domain-containing protein n=1 Tax=Paraburkholderia kirstenboschensis TaxID=1245436 RepID=UPI00191A9E1E|nr:DUF4148 domain-containing protein [Paraburkholderia kirstenboschensis]CAD6557294.1 hypothetical protein LMG28727_06336 [Paraburkholderia kirstenboschensis]
MKPLIRVFAVTAALLLPVASFAQTSSAITPAEVRAELVQIEKPGYGQTRCEKSHCPQDSRAAEAKVVVMNGAGGGSGGVMSGLSQSGQPRDIRMSPYSPPIYIHP